MNLCPACNSVMSVGIRPWHFRCSSCSYEGSELTPAIQSRPDGGDIDEEARERGLGGLRQANFQRLSRRLEQVVEPKDRPRMLDVGCAHGWFIEANRQRYDVAGIEPDVAVAAATSARGLPVRNGFFPDALGGTERFDVIVFNDVLEHIPDVNGVLQACERHLSDHGIVVVNAPSRRGALYAVAGWLARLGFPGSFDRLWQVGLPSPHVHYFDSSTIRAIARNNGFTVESSMTLPSVSLSGLYDRIRCSGQVGAVKAAALTAGVLLAYPFIRLLPPDIEVWFLRKVKANQP